MNFSGIIEMDEIPAIQELLKDAKSFCCYGFDCYERYWDITDEEYLISLRADSKSALSDILSNKENVFYTIMFRRIFLMKAWKQ